MACSVIWERMPSYMAQPVYEEKQYICTGSPVEVGSRYLTIVRIVLFIPGCLCI